MKRQHYHMMVNIENGEIWPSGEIAQLYNSLFRPRPGETRAQLVALRNSMKLSCSHLATLLGTRRATVRKWLSGERRPSSAAAKWIWFLHSTIVRQADVRSLGAWLMWGRSNTEEPAETEQT